RPSSLRVALRLCLSASCPVLSTPLTYPSFNATATTEIHPLSLHDALPILRAGRGQLYQVPHAPADKIAAAFQIAVAAGSDTQDLDRKSTRLNSSHVSISYAVFCLKKKNK